MNRSEQLLSIRPIIKTDNSPTTSDKETFQNEILRPILKFQNESFIYLFRMSTVIGKTNFDKKPDFDKKHIITSTLKTDQKLKNAIIASVTSLMTIEELDLFYLSKSEYQKRIISMVIERLIDQMI